MTFSPIDEVALAGGQGTVYEHGWQSWSPTGTYPCRASSPRPATDWQQRMRFRPGHPPPPGGFQGEGLLVVDPGHGGPVLRYAADGHADAVPSIRAELVGDRLIVTSDGPVTVTVGPDGAAGAAGIGTALADFGVQYAADRGAGTPRRPPTAWCSWYHYFLDVTAADVVENLDAIARHDLPVDVVQVDDGWSAGPGDWLATNERFGSLPDLADLAGRIRDAGRRPGIWVAPFLAGGSSDLARRHPDWLVGDAGWNWDQPLHGLDLTHPGVRDHLAAVFGSLRRAGFDYVKLDFLYAGALPGRRHEDVDPLTAYRSGLALVREALGADTYLVGCGAPLLPSVGLVDAMRVGADTYNPSDEDEDGTRALRGAAGVRARAWQHGRFWVNDPDCLIARPTFPRRAEWARVVARYGGLRSVSDRIADLDGWGLATTRTLLGTVPPPTPFPVEH
ncbi:MAG: glycoside hydrolase family 36 protein [Actinomycetota bacterium]